jgi:probable F420-dependent oxidoreductase
VEPASPFERAAWAEAHGYHSMWLGDGGGHMDALTEAAGIVMQTSRIKACTGVVPVYTRPPAVLATSAMTISRIGADRLILGLGASSDVMVESWYGTPYEKPLTRVRETVALLRQIFAGEKTDFAGETVRSKGFRLGTPVRGTIPIYLAALRPRMLELAGEVADGVIVNFVPDGAMPRLLEHIDKGAKRAGRRVEDVDVVQYVRVWVTSDIVRAEQELRQILAGYFFTKAYNQYLRWLGHEHEAQAMADAFARRDKAGTMAAMPEELVHRIGIFGSAEQCRERVRHTLAQGTNLPVIDCASSVREEYLATLGAFAADAMGTA